MESTEVIQKEFKYLKSNANADAEAFSWESIYGASRNASKLLKDFVADKYPHIYAPIVHILLSPVLFFLVDFAINLARSFFHFISNKFTLLFLFFALYFSANASHLVGGNFSLQHISGNQYQLTLKVFRDCENGIAGFNNNVTVGMYDKANDNLVKKIPMGNIIADDQLVFVGDNCINIPTGCTSVGTYKATIFLDPDIYNSNEGYYISWERCCRNTIIQNIVVGNQPGTTGEVYYMEIPPLKTVNSTPVFNRNPLTLLCVNNPFSFNYDASDADGDSLVYTLVTPLKGFTDSKNPNDDTQKGYPILNAGNANKYFTRYPEVQWQNGYSLYGNIMDGSPKLAIDKFSGQLTVTPTRQGVFAIAIRVEEYRNGEKLGEVRMDLQLTVSSCNSNTAPVYNSASYNKTYVVNATDTLSFPIEITDANNDSLNFKYTGTVFSGSESVSAPYASLNEAKGEGKISTTFTWKTACYHVTGDTQKVNFWVEDNGCPIHKKTLSEVKIIVVPPPTPLPPQMACLERPDANTLRLNFGDLITDKYFAYYLLIRKNPDSTETVIDTIRKNDNKRAITDFTAYNHGVNYYKYYFVGVNICGNYGKRSYYVSSDPNIPFQPAASYIIRVTVKNNKNILLEWDHAKEEDFKDYRIYRKTDLATDSFKLYRIITGRNDTDLTDTTVDVQTTSYCYKIEVTNHCGYTSKPSNTACSIVLKGVSKPFESQLNWNKYIQWKGGVEKYAVMRKDEGTPYAEVGFTTDPQVSFIDGKLNIDWGAYWYKIIAVEGANGRNAISESNEIYLIQEPIVYTPNAFTPDDDSTNDTWGIMPVFVKTYHLKVFNRWGQVVFESSDKHQQWKGIYNNNQPFNNVYIWQMEYTGWDFSRHYANGNVTTFK